MGGRQPDDGDPKEKEDQLTQKIDECGILPGLSWGRMRRHKGERKASPVTYLSEGGLFEVARDGAKLEQTEGDIWGRARGGVKQV